MLIAMTGCNEEQSKVTTSGFNPYATNTPSKPNFGGFGGLTPSGPFKEMKTNTTTGTSR